MVCFKPLHAKKVHFVADTGELKSKLVFPPEWQGHFRQSLAVMQAHPQYTCVACGQCIGCRIDRSKDWAHRCMHELQFHEQACFVTLTYDDAHLPRDGSLVYDHFQRFFKRLRYSLGGKKVKYYMCGEYGDVTKRPHFHFILFGHDFDDKVLYKSSRGHRLYNSQSLSDLWRCGHAVIGDVTFESCAYVARYILKKVNGKKADGAYTRTDSTGKSYKISPEFTHMSQGIGKRWCEKYVDDCLPSGYIVFNGKKARLPKFYCKRFEVIVPVRYQAFKVDQVLRMRELTSTDKYRANHEILRLLQRESCFRLKVKKLVRQL